jgi:hypothetical protein
MALLVRRVASCDARCVTTTRYTYEDSSNAVIRKR